MSVVCERVFDGGKGREGPLCDQSQLDVEVE